MTWVGALCTSGMLCWQYPGAAGGGVRWVSTVRPAPPTAAVALLSAKSAAALLTQSVQRHKLGAPTPQATPWAHKQTWNVLTPTTTASPARFCCSRQLLLFRQRTSHSPGSVTGFDASQLPSHSDVLRQSSTYYKCPPFLPALPTAGLQGAPWICPGFIVPGRPWRRLWLWPTGRSKTRRSHRRSWSRRGRRCGTLYVQQVLRISTVLAWCNCAEVWGGKEWQR